MPLEAPAASWLQVLRNPGHGFGSGPANTARDDVLLMAHDGRVLADLPDLPYPYLLGLLAHPEKLRRAWLIWRWPYQGAGKTHLRIS